MPFVVDASVAASWILPDEVSQEATHLARRLEEAEALVPDLFWHEMRNLVVLARRRGRLDDDVLLLALTRIGRLPVHTRGPGDPLQVTQLALKHNMTAYDAAYLALALSERRALATRDRALRSAALAEGLVVFPETLT